MDYYRNLRVTNPSNYLYFYDFGHYQIIGASPESLVSVKKGEVTTNPIAGTRPRGATEEEDLALAHELLHDIKETAEHRMLVDLGRNDIGKIAQNGTVEVTKYMEVEYFRYVMHLTSVVKGQLLPHLTALDALKATLPVGTVSGAPKIRAMRRIYELEQEKRGGLCRCDRLPLRDRGHGLCYCYPDHDPQKSKGLCPGRSRDCL